jgi:hypothetical protein
MAAMSEVRTLTARKNHRCSWCGEIIKFGERYSRYRVWIGYDTSTVKMHPECLDASGEEAREAGGWIEWTPGEAERPRKEI